MKLGRFSCGVGDRFGRQGSAQIKAFFLACRQGVLVIPVWNKSWREHSIVGTSPLDVRCEVDRAVSESGWQTPYFVDADHVSANNLAHFIEASDFFTLDIVNALILQAEKKMHSLS